MALSLDIERDNGDRDTLILCRGCSTSIADYAKILRKMPVAGRCERCGEGGKQLYKVHADPKGGNQQVGEPHDNLNRAKKYAINLARSQPGSVYGVRGAGGQLLASFGPYRAPRVMLPPKREGSDGS
jgi:hypothetical protein